MMMGIDHDCRAKCITEFQKSISTVDESCIDQQPIDKKGINSKKGNSKKSTGHLYGDDRTFLF
jgi:hypothetical protein